MSAGQSCDTEAQVVQNAVNAGMLVVAAAGNSGASGLVQPTLNTSPRARASTMEVRFMGEGSFKLCRPLRAPGRDPELPKAGLRDCLDWRTHIFSLLT